MVQQSFHNSDRLETTILNNLFFQEDYARKVLPFLKEERNFGKPELKKFTNILKEEPSLNVNILELAEVAGGKT